MVAVAAIAFLVPFDFTGFLATTCSEVLVELTEAATAAEAIVEVEAEPISSFVVGRLNFISALVGAIVATDFANFDALTGLLLRALFPAVDNRESLCRVKNREVQINENMNR